MTEYTLSQNNALEFARKVVDTSDKANASWAYDRLDTQFAKDVDNRSVDRLVAALDRLANS